MTNVEQTIISQYSATATISQLIKNMNAYIDPTTDFDNFYNYVWNVETAQGFGLDIWGRIVNISRELEIPGDLDYFGFEEAGDALPFDDGIFYNGDPATQTYLLADDAYRKLILVKALANISSTNAPSINQLIQNLFGIDRGRAYVNDLGNMQLMYTFEFSLTDVEYAIVTQSGAFPRPAGVKAFFFAEELPLFGFAEAGDSAAPFDEGVFY
jgi:Protein of unknown function (DUF2612)